MTDNCSYGRPLTTSAKTSRSRGAKELQAAASQQQMSPLGAIPALSIDQLLLPQKVGKDLNSPRFNCRR
jgi:hypothetical protein